MMIPPLDRSEDALHSAAGGQTKLVGYEPPPGAVLVNQIILIALVAGLVFYAGFVLMNLDAPFSTEVQSRDLLGVLLAGLAIVASRIVPPIVARMQFKQFDFDENLRSRVKMDDGTEATPISVYTIYLVLKAALLEGPAFFNIFAFSQSGSIISIGVAVLLIALMLTLMPTRDRIARWVEVNLQTAQERF